MNKRLSLIVIAAAALALGGCAERGAETTLTSEFPQPKESSGGIKQGQIVWSGDEKLAPALKPLEDKANPYSGKYGEWDRWVYTNKIAARPTMDLRHQFADWTFVAAQVTREGHLVPLVEAERELEEAARQGREPDYAALGRSFVYGAGIMTPDLAKAMHSALWKTKASFYPRIPAWLGENPPRGCILLADGRVVTSGRLGSHEKASGMRAIMHQDESSCCGGMTDSQLINGEDVAFCLYNADGALVGETPGIWLHLISPEWGRIIDRFNMTAWDGNITFYQLDNQGYYQLKAADGSLLGAFDYTGKQLKPGQAIVPRDQHNFMMIQPHELATLYTAQNS